MNNQNRLLIKLSTFFIKIIKYVISLTRFIKYKLNFIKHVFKICKNYIFKLSLFIILLIFVPFLTFGYTELDKVFDEANNFYENENFNQALEMYKLLIDSGIKNKALYYNVANTYMQVEPIQIGEAIFYYNKALEFDPSDSDISNNLNVARSLVVSDYSSYDKNENSIISRILNFLYINFTLDLLIWIFIILSTILSLSFVIYFLSMKKNGLFLKFGIIFLILMVIIFSFLIIRYRFDIMTDYGVITESEADIYRLPSDNQQILFTLTEGVELEVIKKISDEWFHIILSGGIKGYIKSDVIKTY